MSANHIYIIHTDTRNQKKSNSGVFITRFANQYVLRFLLEERKKTNRTRYTHQKHQKMKAYPLK